MKNLIEKIKKVPVKKILIISGAAILLVGLVGASYVFGRGFSQKKSRGNFVDLGNGKQLRMENPVSGQNRNMPDMMGKIKSINDRTIVIDKYAMPKRTDNSAAEAGQRRAGNNGAENYQGQGQPGASRPQLQVEGEETITLAEDASIQRNNRSFQPGQQRTNNSGNNQPQDISVGDLKEGDVISIWFSSNSGNNVAQRVVARGM